MPDLIAPPSGCRFNPRCPYAMDICRKEKPPMMEIRPNHMAACHLYTGVTYERRIPRRGHQPQEVFPDSRGFLPEGDGFGQGHRRRQFPIEERGDPRSGGESGCGKTTTGRCTLQLIRPTEGNIYYKMPAKDRSRMVELETLEAESFAKKRPKKRGNKKKVHSPTDPSMRELWELRSATLNRMKDEDLRYMRKEMQIVFQDPFSSLNPRFLIKTSSVSRS